MSDSTPRDEENGATTPLASGQAPPKSRGVERLLESADSIVRAIVALSSLGLLALVILLAFGKAQTWAETKELLNLVLPAITLVLGAAGGYFFGKEK